MYDIDSRFTVKSLKSVCSALNLPVGGTKGLLQQRLRSYFDQLVNKRDTVQFNIGKATTEAERGVAYGQSHRLGYDIYRGRGIDYSRPNGYPSSGSSTTATPSQTNTWGMSPLYQNIRLRMSFLITR